MSKIISIKIPNGYMNSAVTVDNQFIADTNDSSNWDTIRFPLPEGSWNIKNVDTQRHIVTLISYE